MPKMNHMHMWNRLRVEMLGLNRKGVTSLHPVIVLAYMNFLELMELKKEERKNEATT